MRDTIRGLAVWMCPTPACRDRQLRWTLDDAHGVLMHVPLPKQAELEEAVASQQYGGICLGGSRGGGKSKAWRLLCYRYCQKIPDFTVLFLRRLLTDLELNHIKFVARDADRLNAKLTSNKLTFHQTNAEIRFAHCQDPDDYKKYVGAEVDLLVFDQLEQFLQKQFTEIAATTGRILRDDWRGLLGAGENPGGPLSDFVDHFFITKDLSPRDYPDYDPTQYHFITADLEDNAYVDPRYVNFLAGIEPEKRAMYRFGRRDIFPGQYFKDFHHPARIQHLTIPDTAPRLCGLHWGFFTPGIYLWAVVLPDGRLYLERELPFRERIAEKVAQEAQTRSAKFPRTVTWANPPAELPDDEIGEDVIETFQRAGVPVIRSQHDAVSGYQRLQHWLQPMPLPDGSDQPMLIVDPSCETVIATLPQLLQDPTHTEDIDPASPAHAAKALRYIVMSRPNLPKPNDPPKGRDLSKLEDKTRADIERLTRIEAGERGDLVYGEQGYPWGDFWA